jgi:hypothetical protein
MPVISVNLGDVQEFTNLDFGTYYGELEKVVLKEATEQGKFDQLRAQYMVLDEGPNLGRRQSEFRSFSPNAMGFMKGWFKKFGLGEIPDLDFDDDTLELMNPDLAGSKVIFEVVADAKAPGGSRTNLVSVEELGPGVPVDGVEAPVTRAAPKAHVAPPATEEEVEIEEEEAAEAAVPEPEAPKRVVPTRQPAATPATAAKPVRRTLR